MIGDILEELFSMFAGDWRMSVPVLVAIGGIAVYLMRLDGDPVVAGGLLIVSALAALTSAVLRAAREKRGG